MASIGYVEYWVRSTVHLKCLPYSHQLQMTDLQMDPIFNTTIKNLTFLARWFNHNHNKEGEQYRAAGPEAPATTTTAVFPLSPLL